MKAKQDTGREGQQRTISGFEPIGERNAANAIGFTPSVGGNNNRSSSGITAAPCYYSRDSSFTSNSSFGTSPTTDTFDVVEEFGNPLPRFRGAGSRHEFGPDYERLNSARTVNSAVSYTAALRHRYPRYSVTLVPEPQADIIAFANGGNAKITLDSEDEGVHRLYFVSQGLKQDDPVQLREEIEMGKYLVSWLSEEFIVYKISMGYTSWLWILKEPDVERGETTLSQNKKSEMLIEAAAKWGKPNDEYLYVYDWHSWTRSKKLWEEVQKASWKDVILDEDMKVGLTDITEKFFDSRDVYKDLGVPWRRGIIFHGPPGNGKTISIKALMNQISTKYKGKQNVNILYVREASQTWDITNVFSLARQLSPCLLVLEDIETIVTPPNRSYFFNEVDGLENNDGIMIVASTNYLDKLDPGLSKRPSRFDRKYFFPLPSEHERALYCEYWRKKLHDKPITFPSKLCSAIAGITDGFSFAYLKEAFVATLLVIAGNKQDDNKQGNIEAVYPFGDDNDLDKYELWREMKRQVKILRDDMGTGDDNVDREPFQKDRKRWLHREMHGQPTWSKPDVQSGPSRFRHEGRAPRKVSSFNAGGMFGERPVRAFNLDHRRGDEWMV